MKAFLCLLTKLLIFWENCWICNCFAHAQFQTKERAHSALLPVFWWKGLLLLWRVISWTRPLIRYGIHIGDVRQDNFLLAIKQCLFTGLQRALYLNEKMFFTQIEHTKMINKARGTTKDVTTVNLWGSELAALFEAEINASQSSCLWFQGQSSLSSDPQLSARNACKKLWSFFSSSSSEVTW